MLKDIQLFLEQLIEKDVECDVIIHCFKNLEDLESKRKTFGNQPVLILFEKELDTVNVERNSNEEVYFHYLSILQNLMILYRLVRKNG